MDIKIGFTNLNTAADGVRVYRSLNPIDPNSLPAVYATLAGNATTYTDSGVVKDTQYYYIFEVYKGADHVFSANIKATAVAYSGPGNQVLKGGDLSMGYYGIVPAIEFLSWDTLLTWSGVTLSAKSTTTSQDWLKFAYKGKTLFFAQQPIGTISWNNLYLNGLVYGTNDNGPREYNTQTATNQQRIITVQGMQFKVRLPTGLPPGFDKTAAIASANAATVAGPIPNWYTPESSDNSYDLTGSEWNDLMTKVVSFTQPSQRGKNWDRLESPGIAWQSHPTNYAGAGLHHHQEMMSNVQTVVRGILNGNTYAPNYAVTANPSVVSYWRPVLEMI